MTETQFIINGIFFIILVFGGALVAQVITDLKSEFEDLQCKLNKCMPFIRETSSHIVPGIGIIRLKCGDYQKIASEKDLLTLCDKVSHIENHIKFLNKKGTIKTKKKAHKNDRN